MVALSMFPLPLSSVPPGYSWEGRTMSVLSTTTAFDTGINSRDIFLGERRCIICGMTDVGVLQHCHIMPASESYTWSDLKTRGWVPREAKGQPQHEPRNGLLMCANHQTLFNGYKFFIRYIPKRRTFILVNYSNILPLQQYHGKVIALDIQHRYAPFPSIFIIHEMRVRGFHPFEPIETAMPNNSPWQDWILSDSVFDNQSGSFRHDMPADDLDGGHNPSMQLLSFQPSTLSASGPSSGGQLAPLNLDTVASILAATRAMPSWKACQMEGTSWAGTAEENMQKYVSSIGVEDDDACSPE